MSLFHSPNNATELNSDLDKKMNSSETRNDSDDAETSSQRNSLVVINKNESTMINDTTDEMINDSFNMTDYFGTKFSDVIFDSSHQMGDARGNGDDADNSGSQEHNEDQDYDSDYESGDFIVSQKKKDSLEIFFPEGIGRR